MKELRIFEKDGHLQITHSGMGVMEIMGVLRFYEKLLWLQTTETIMAAAKRKTMARHPIAEVREKKITTRLFNALEEYQKAYNVVFVDEIEKQRFLRTRNAGERTWIELQTIANKK